MSRPVSLPAWQALFKHQQEMADGVGYNAHMRDLFARDPQRFERFSLRLGDILLDYSKNRITDKTLSLRTFSEAVRAGAWKGYSGQVIADVINIGGCGQLWD